ncbi:protein tyrosine phosphatase 2 [Choristoneura biennis entomopoxvirus]|uniref:Protein tyrosine phosphatase 2 n=1 Tax=Choristoneura biennis entomopoxvirus TaxID=10288 RepID=A0A916KPP5_CBEPV|nr:protein tyrosine phosphatase 2 [Choristoneura biennis entomopoxvirus]CCU55702.1 protein tyrosine phosphatase 2 [Choristoneura biennis entomopoxvirus]
MNISKINNNIYLGGLYNYNIEELKNFLSNNNIKCIITIWNLERLDIKKLNINENDYLYIYADDTTNEIIMNYFDITNDFIISKINEGKKILIHCYAGISRSATIVINYIMNKYDIDFNSAKLLVQDKRKINPNDSFVYQLKLYNINKNIKNNILFILYIIKIFNNGILYT